MYSWHKSWYSFIVWDAIRYYELQAVKKSGARYMSRYTEPRNSFYLQTSSDLRLNITLPPRMRHSLIYNYLREPGVSMLQNAYKHPCSKHLTTVGKGTHFFPNWDNKTHKKLDTTLLFNKSVSHLSVFLIFAVWLIKLCRFKKSEFQ